MSFCFFFVFIYCFIFLLFFFFNDTATTEIYTLSLHDALPILVLFEPRTELGGGGEVDRFHSVILARDCSASTGRSAAGRRSEEHTSELQSQSNLVCRLLLEKKKKKIQSKTSD